MTLTYESTPRWIPHHKCEDAMIQVQEYSIIDQAKSVTCSENNLESDTRLIPNAIDELARTQPDKVFASIPLTTDIADGFKDVTYLEYANAIDRAAMWLENNLGNGCHGEPIGYLAPSDLRYVILTIAAVKVGCTVCLGWGLVGGCNC